MSLRHQDPARARLCCEGLEDRLVPAVTFRFDYSFDSTGFFNDPAHRAALERAAADLASRIASTPAAITPGPGDSWSAVFNNPATGAQAAVPNPAIPAGTILVYAGASDLGGSEAGEGGPGGYQAGGSAAFRAAVGSRGLPGFGPWGGSLSVDPGRNWYFGADPAGLARGQIDFQTVA